MVFNSLLGRTIIGREIARRQGVSDPAEQLRLGLVGGFIGSPTVGLIATTAIARQKANQFPATETGNPPATGGGGPAANRAIVPDLKGKSIDEATDELNSVGLKLVQVGANSNQDNVGSIISQTPEPNTSVSRNTTVTVTVNAGTVSTATGTMPLVQGKSLAEAKALILEKANGRISEANISIVFGYAKDAQPGQVVMQDPDPGTPISDSTQPTLVVIESTVVPQLEGGSMSTALLKLSASKLVPEVTEAEQDGKGKVKSQHPAPGTEVAVFTPVKIGLETSVGVGATSRPDNLKTSHVG